MAWMYTTQRSVWLSSCPTCPCSCPIVCCSDRFSSQLKAGSFFQAYLIFTGTFIRCHWQNSSRGLRMQRLPPNHPFPIYRDMRTCPEAALSAYIAAQSGCVPHSGVSKDICIDREFVGYQSIASGWRRVVLARHRLQHPTHQKDPRKGELCVLLRHGWAATYSHHWYCHLMGH